MANKIIAVFLMCIVVATTTMNLSEATMLDDEFKLCFNNCEQECKGQGHGNTYCEMKCDTDCVAMQTSGKL